MERFEVIQLLRLYRYADGEIRTVMRLHISDDQKREKVDALNRFREEMATAIQSLEYVQKDAILSHYVRGQKWEIVRRRHCYSEKQIRNISNNGLLALGKELESCETACCLLRREEGGHTT